MPWSRSLRGDMKADGDGIATLLFRSAPQAEVPSPAWLQSFARQLDEALATDARGVLIAIGDDSARISSEGAESSRGSVSSGQRADEVFARGREYAGLLRRLETCGRPVVAAIGSHAVGTLFDLMMACRYRVISDHPGISVGLGWSGIDLLSLAGSTQRLPRLAGVAKALPLLLQASLVTPQMARQLGIVDELVPPGEVRAAARRHLLGQPERACGWDRPGYRVPGGSAVASPPLGFELAAATARAAMHRGPRLSPEICVLSAVFEGIQVPFDLGLRLEGKHLGRLQKAGVTPR